MTDRHHHQHQHSPTDRSVWNYQNKQAEQNDQAEQAARSHRRPRIGLTTYYTTAAWGVWNNPAALLPASYVNAVVRAGGAPLLIPPVDPDPEVLDLLDALVVVGGSDLDPASYGREPHPATVSEPLRDAADLLLAREAIRRQVPLLAICRGAQVLNVALGGTLIQHLPDLLGHDDYRPAPGVFGSVQVATTPGSRIAAAVGASANPACYHHQAIDDLAAGLQVTARSADGLIQAVEPDPEHPAAPQGWVLGVQFHPEEDPGDPLLFTALLRATVAEAGGD